MSKKIWKIYGIGEFNDFEKGIQVKGDSWWIEYPEDPLVKESDIKKKSDNFKSVTFLREEA